MLRRERIIKRFTFGISVLTSYINCTGNLNMQDINIMSEQFVCDLLNLLYDIDLKNVNGIVRNNLGYDLISESKKIIVQVSATDTSKKIVQTLNKIEKRMFKYLEWNQNLENIRKQREENPLSYTSIVRETAEKLESKIKNAVDLNGYTVYIMTLQLDAAKQRQYKTSF